MTSDQRPARPPLFEVTGPMADPKGPNTLGGVARLYFTHISAKIILASLTPLLVIRAWVGEWRAWDAGILLISAAAWPFFEWIFHVAIHRRPLRLGAFTLDPVAARWHRLHHVDPTVTDYTLLPPGPLVAMAIGSVAGFWLLLGRELGLTASICFHLGGLANGWVHLLTHTRYVPRSRYFRWVRRTHTLHHFKNESYWFAFTGPFVDVLLGTHRNPAAVATSAACASRRGVTIGAVSSDDDQAAQPADPADR